MTIHNRNYGQKSKKLPFLETKKTGDILWALETAKNMTRGLEIQGETLMKSPDKYALAEFLKQSARLKSYLSAIEMLARMNVRESKDFMFGGF